MWMRRCHLVTNVKKEPRSSWGSLCFRLLLVVESADVCAAINTSSRHKCHIWFDRCSFTTPPCCTGGSCTIASCVRGSLRAAEAEFHSCFPGGFSAFFKCSLRPACTPGGEGGPLWLAGKWRKVLVTVHVQMQGIKTAARVSVSSFPPTSQPLNHVKRRPVN